MTASMTARRKLVLHLDIQNTMILTDSKRGVSMAQALNTFLAGMVWGEVDRTGKWSCVSDKPSLEPPFPGAVSYYRHMEKHIAYSPSLNSPREVFRQRIQTFTERKGPGQRFSTYVQNAMEKLEWKHGSCLEQFVEHGGKKYHYIFPSVFRLVQYLEEERREYCIILRTFGDDAPQVLKHLEAGLTEPKVKVNSAVGCIHRTHPDNITLELLNEYTGERFLQSDSQEIYHELSSLRGIHGIKDDYGYWRNNGYHPSAGKPLWLKPGDSATHHILFDDNIRLDEPDSVVDVHLLAEDRHRETTSDQTEGETPAKTFKDACLVQVNLLEAICQENYFVDKVTLCEDNYGQFISQ